ncbi:response regulator [Sandaracinus amylolyticus]|uniref:response regulator n=1 Tax=Sandaracinus amylolyticus TaxID=927083 RepID=UPI001F006EE9|nr:response regulator [Sandaracinus amylolyticus]UJR82357.1 Hypothetical protein I5071_44220 [Sandaracinus amylolyticus]
MPQATRWRVLLVDDEDVLLQSMSAVLEDDFEVVVASDGARALERIEEQPFDVVCSDYKMPRMDGLELLRRLRERAIDVGFVLVTGMRDYKLATQPDGDQFHCVLLKPCDPAQLIESIQRAATFAQMRRAVDAAQTASSRLRKRGA